MAEDHFEYVSGNKMRSTTDKALPSLTFVIPVVHPDVGRVSSYEMVERILRETVASLTSVEDATVRVVVVCHRIPEWHDAVSWNVRFLNLEDHERFAPASRDYRMIDKAKKILAGISWAIADHDPDLIMPIDGDDFVRKDIAAVCVERLREVPQADGIMIQGGYHVALKPVPEGFEVNGVIEIDTFARSCGSCRVFRAENLWGAVLAEAPEFGALRRGDLLDEEGRPRTGFLGLVADFADRTDENLDGFIQVLGRHGHQHVLFALADVEDALAAKGCGHGNHAGPKAGEIHWHRITRLQPIKTFLAQFGLENRPSFVSRPAAGNRLRAARALLKRGKSSGIATILRR